MASDSCNVSKIFPNILNRVRDPPSSLPHPSFYSPFLSKKSIKKKTPLLQSASRGRRQQSREREGFGNWLKIPLASSSVEIMALKRPVFLHGDNREKKELVEQEGNTEQLAMAFTREEEEDDVESSQSSSIGVNSPSSSDDEEEEAQSKLKDEKGFSISLDSLEESLPIKRGLSNSFAGKSKSFASLSDTNLISAKDLVKPENSFNKRRRILMTCKNSWRRRASYNSLMPSLPPLTSNDLVVKEEEDEDRGDGDLFFPLPPLTGHGDQRSLKKTFIKSSRSFSLTELTNS